jgi:hypothetical protein
MAIAQDMAKSVTRLPSMVGYVDQLVYPENVVGTSRIVKLKG